MSKTILKSPEMTVDTVDDHTTSKADGTQNTYQKATLKCDSGLTVSIKDESLPEGLKEGSKVVIKVVSEQETLSTE